MSKSHKDLLDWIFDQLEQRAAKFNGIQCTARGGFFKILMRCPPGWGPEGQTPLEIPLLFSFKDLYLLGFMQNNIWYLFKDANVNWDDFKEHKEACKPLDFYGRYNNVMFSAVPVGFYELYLSYDTLSNHPSRQQDEIKVALYRIMVVISEAIRFPVWRDRLLEVLKTWGSDSVDFNSDFQTTSFLFQNWSHICKKVLRGAAEFKPGKMFTTYVQISSSVSLILSQPEEGPDDEEPEL